jgi:raffinose/stachyose/melibiose transport system substrate-binding protein
LAVIGLLGALLAPTLGGGVHVDAKAGTASSTPTVTLWSWRPQDAQLWKQVGKQLNITINFRPIVVNLYFATLATAMQGGKGPDIFFSTDGNDTFQYAQTHLIQSTEAAGVDISKISPSVSSRFALNGKHWGIPYALQTLHVFYNKAIFQKYHLSPPKTWEDLIQLCKTLQSHGVTPFNVMGTQPRVLNHTIDEILSSTASGAWNQDLIAGKTNYQSAPFIEALTKTQALIPFFEHNYVASGSPTGSSQWEALALGQAAMIFDGIYAVPGIMGYNPKLQLGSFLIPPSSAAAIAKFPGKPADYTHKAQVDWYIDGDIALNAKIANSDENAAAVKLWKFMATPQFGQLFTQVAGDIIPMNGVKLPASYPLSIKAYNELLTQKVSPVIDVSGPLNVPPLSADGAPANGVNGMWAVMQPLSQQLFANQITPQQFASSMDSGMSWYFKSHK